MLFIGITGSFASGKSYLLNLLNEEGFKTFSSDKFVSDLYKQQNIQDQILKLIPSLTVFDTKEIAKKIYDDDDARRKIEALIHPIVLKNILDFKKNYEHEKFIFIEVPLLFEVGWENYFDYVITAFCSNESRLKHAKSKASFNKDIYDKLEKIQLPQDEKIARADFVINMDAKMLELKIQIFNILENL